MCLAEALLRIPDDATCDALIRDKIAEGDWKSHIGRERSLFVKAASWGLVVTGKLVDAADDGGFAAALTGLAARAGELVICRGLDLAMRMLGERFVTGGDDQRGVGSLAPDGGEGVRQQLDMLGEAATTAADAARYFADYESALHAIGRASAGRDIYARPGISIKLPALHPTLCAHAGQARDDRATAAPDGAGSAGEELRHRPHRRRRRGRPVGTFEGWAIDS